jgi:hypothetical protein
VKKGLVGEWPKNNKDDCQLQLQNSEKGQIKCWITPVR